MLAGVGGIDAALFVVLVDEGVMPQDARTPGHPRSAPGAHRRGGAHQDRCCDGRRPDRPGRGRSAHDPGRHLAWPMRPSFRGLGAHGRSLPQLRQALDVLRRAAAPRQGRPRLPIDCVFTIAGFGTVVTGTLSDGQLAVGDEVEILPDGLKARIIPRLADPQARSRSACRAAVAINSDWRPPGRRRGMAGPAERAAPDHAHRCAAAGAQRRLRRGQAQRAWISFSGAADGRRAGPGVGRRDPFGSVMQLALEAPIVVEPGSLHPAAAIAQHDRPAACREPPAHPARRWRRFQADVLQQLETLACTPEDLVFHALARSEPALLKDIVEGLGLQAADAEAVVAELVASREILPPRCSRPLARSLTPPRWAGGTRWPHEWPRRCRTITHSSAAARHGS